MKRPREMNSRSGVLFTMTCATLLAFLSDGIQAFAADEPVRFAYQDRVADAASVVAVHENFFAAEGLTVKPLRFSSGPATAEALYSGSADVGTMGDSTAVIAAARRAGLIIIASHGGGEKRHRVVVRSGLKLVNAKDLAGKTVAVKKGTSTYGGLLEYLKANGLSFASVRIVDSRPADMPEALTAGSVDAICASEPTPSLAESRGGKPFADLSGLGNTYPILLMARETFLAKRPGDTVKFLRAMSQATEFVSEQPEKTAGILAKVSGLHPGLCLQAMKRHSYALTLDEAIVVSLMKTGQSLADHRNIPKAPDIRKFMRPDLLRQALSK
jgi:sulfonate transport system substrate-binding protein